MTPPIRAAHHRLVVSLALIAAAGVAAGCSEGASDGGAAAATEPRPAAVPLVERVVRGSELTGFSAPAPAREIGLAAIAAENEVSVAELRRRGVARAAKVELAGPPEAFAISAVAELGTAAAARAEAARLLAANGSSEPGLTARPIAVPTIPEARGARKSGRRNGREYVAFEVVWTDGALTHELFVLGRVGDVRQRDVIAAATTVHARTAGAPLAD